MNEEPTYFGYPASLKRRKGRHVGPGRGKTTLNKGHVNQYSLADFQLCLKQCTESITPQAFITGTINYANRIRGLGMIPSGICAAIISCFKLKAGK